MAIKARDLRKRLMGTVEINSLLSPELTERVNNKVNTLVEEAIGQRLVKLLGLTAIGKAK
jgi:hypothetical protein